MTNVRSVVVSTIVISSFLALASAQNQQGNPPQNQPQPGTAAPQGGPASSRQGPEGNGGGAQPGECKQEIEKACPGMKPGDGKWGPCVKQNMDSFSPKCKRRLHRMIHRWRENHQGGQGQGHNQGGQKQNGPAPEGQNQGDQPQGEQQQ